MAVATGRHASTSTSTSMVHAMSSKDAPSNHINMEGRNMGHSKCNGGREFAIGNLPAMCTWKSLKAHAKMLGAAPTWAVTYGSHGAIGFETALTASHAFKLLASSPIFLGSAITIAWNIDHRSRHSARSCRYGTLCRGCNTYCKFARSSSSGVVGHVLSDSSVVSRRRSPRIRGAVEVEEFDDDVVRVVLNDLDSTVIANHSGISLGISASDAMRAHENI